MNTTIEKIMPRKKRSRQSDTLCSFILLLTLPFNVYALNIQWNQQPYSHYSENEPLNDVIAALMTSQNIPVVTSKSIESTVNIDFRSMLPETFFTQLVSAYHLTWYYDGQILYVYNMDEINTGSLKLSHISVSQFSESLTELGILDSRFSWRKSNDDQLVYFSGPERFTSIVMEMAKVLDTAKSKRIERRAASRPTIYRWKDKQGVVRFSTTRPNKNSAKVKARIVSKANKMKPRTHHNPSAAIKPLAAKNVVNQ